MFEILPGILEKDWESIERKIELVRPFARSIHLDLIDGNYAPNITFLDPKPFAKYTKDIFFEVHLMVDNPAKYLKPWADAGIKRFIGQIEKMHDQEDFIDQARFYGEVGLAIDGPTPLNYLDVAASDLDYFLVMTIKAGFSGQPFNPEYLEKVKKIRNQSETIPIEVDGGINSETIILARDAGANRFAATSAIYKYPDPEQAFHLLENQLKK